MNNVLVCDMVCFYRQHKMSVIASYLCSRETDSLERMTAVESAFFMYTTVAVPRSFDSPSTFT